MSLRNQTIYNIVMVLLSWLTIPLFKYRGIKRYLPASLLIVLFEAINVQVGKKENGGFFIKNHILTFLENFHSILVLS